jgi:uncharacterized membrane protein HdeD (DUF308 family)
MVILSRRLLCVREQGLISLLSLSEKVMKLGYRIVRAALLLIPAILLFSSTISLPGVSIVFGIALLIGAFATMLYLFFHFDKKINAKILMEGLADAFFGLVLFTYPTPDNQFFLIIFSAWIFFMGALQLVTGLTSMEDTDYFWLYILAGLTFLAMGFVIMNYNPRFEASIPMLIAIVLVFFSTVNLFLLIKRKKDIYEN